MEKGQQVLEEDGSQMDRQNRAEKGITLSASFCDNTRKVSVWLFGCEALAQALSPVF